MAPTYWATGGWVALSNYKVSIKEMPENMRPREKLMLGGESSLSEAELLAIVIGIGSPELNAVELANYLLIKYSGLRNLKEATLEELMQEKGIGRAKAVRIKAAIEIGRRIAMDIKRTQFIQSPDDVSNLVMDEMRYYDREHFRVIYLNRKGGIITMEDVSVGGLHSSLVHPREVFKTAIKKSAASLILVHNHPSGDPSPSKEDIDITKRLIEAGNIIGIEVIDHIIIGEKKYVSLKARGLL
ncbi:MAG: RadC family protein [Syntrophomonadaceae bacterium]|jgi:DNA repair protein RadC